MSLDVTLIKPASAKLYNGTLLDELDYVINGALDINSEVKKKLDNVYNTLKEFIKEQTDDYGWCSKGDEYYSANITHNLGTMAKEAGIYEHLWSPEEINITTADQLIAPLKDGLKKLKNNKEYYTTFNSSNGWGTYEHFVPFVENYLNACIDHPDAIVYVDR
jgi:hypothetical protein